VPGAAVVPERDLPSCVPLSPFLILAIALAAFLGPSLTNAMIAIGISATPIFIRLTRAQVLAAKAEDYVEAARALDNPHWRIALRHIFPNIVAPLIVQATLASLSFLGLGQQPPAPSWGSMLNTARNYVDQAPWMAIWPGLSIFLPVLSFNLLGDGLRDALDPRHKWLRVRFGRGRHQHNAALAVRRRRDREHRSHQAALAGPG
jgi:peptide/nickel transport system permease protein